MYRKDKTAVQLKPQKRAELLTGCVGRSDPVLQVTKRKEPGPDNEMGGSPRIPVTSNSLRDEAGMERKSRF